MINTLQNKVSINLDTEKEIEELKIRVNNETKVVEEANYLMEKISQKNAGILMNDPSTIAYFDEIKLEIEEQNEKFVSDTEKKGIEIKMEVPTAPAEDEITPDITNQNVQEVPAHEINNKIDDIESVNSHEEEEESEMERMLRIHANNDRLLAAWVAQCTSEGFELSNNIEKEIEFTPEDKEKVVLDESVYENEIKIEDKKSFPETDIPKPKKKSFHRRRKEELKKRAFSKRIIITIVQEEKSEKRRKRKRNKIQSSIASNLTLRTS